MKLMAMRIDETAGRKDLPDLLNLIEVLGIAQKSDLMTFAQAFYPEARVSAHVVLGITALWQERTRLQQQSPPPEAPRESPRYLDRSGPTPK